MHRIPFPVNLSTGIDIVYLPRINRLISKREGSRLIPFTKRILHPLELRDLSRRYPKWREEHQGTGSGPGSLVKWLGGRFAAKEAARKAMGATVLGWKDVRVVIEHDFGQPRIICATKNVHCEDIEHEAMLSIAHDGDYVVATVLAAVQPGRLLNGQD